MHRRIAQALRWVARLVNQQLAHAIQEGAAVEARRQENLPVATAPAAFDATAEDIMQAANGVRNADVVAAPQVAQTVAAAEPVRETNGRAGGVALTVRGTAVAPLTDEHRARPVDRTSDPDEHEHTTPVHEARAPADGQKTKMIHPAVAQRDSRAELRDRVADERRRAASLRPLRGYQQSEDYEQHTGCPPDQRAAAMDQPDARTDRACAASDQASLRAQPSPASGASGASEQRMSEFAAELSHDLRVPLSSIIASVEMLKDELRDHSDRSIAVLLGSATRASDRMARMLEQNMATPIPGEPTALPEVDLAEVVRQLVLGSADLLRPVGAVVEAGELPVVRADPDAMYSVLQNLLTNAVKFARPGVPAVVRISARRSVDGWRISVRDNGVGLPDNSGLDVFSLFSRGTSTVTGHGIGLATVTRVVAEHGGRVGAAPVETGAEIWFELPETTSVR